MKGSHCPEETSLPGQLLKPTGGRLSGYSCRTGRVSGVPANLRGRSDSTVTSSGKRDVAQSCAGTVATCVADHRESVRPHFLLEICAAGKAL